ncbi:hypothetical protein [Burkholderia multivorans]|nr:hypothetical protein [Burkholderia multivorans]
MTSKLTTAERATIMDACASISRSADALKECHTVDGDWGDDVDAKAFYEAELRLLARLTALLAAHPGQPEPRECRHCGWMCIPNSTPSTTHYPLPQPEPSGEVTGDTVLVPKCVVELLRIINRYGIIKRDSELQGVYRLVDAARAQGGEKS